MGTKAKECQALCLPGQLHLAPLPRSPHRCMWRPGLNNTAIRPSNLNFLTQSKPRNSLYTHGVTNTISRMPTKQQLCSKLSSNQATMGGECSVASAELAAGMVFCMATRHCFWIIVECSSAVFNVQPAKPLQRFVPGRSMNFLCRNGVLPVLENLTCKRRRRQHHVVGMFLAWTGKENKTIVRARNSNKQFSTGSGWQIDCCIAVTRLPWP